MNQKEFEQYFSQFTGQASHLLVGKGQEYAGADDRLANFKRGAKLAGIAPLTVLFVYLSKHYDALASYVRDPEKLVSEPIEGRLHDLVNYCILAGALIYEERHLSAPKENYIGDEPIRGTSR